MNKFILFVLISLGLVVGYNRFIKGKRIEDNSLVRKVQLNQQKTGSVALIGILLKTSSGSFNLTTEQGIVRLKSSEVKLDDYVFEKIRVVGMFSGTSLYIDQVEVQ